MRNKRNRYVLMDQVDDAKAAGGKSEAELEAERIAAEEAAALAEAAATLAAIEAKKAAGEQLSEEEQAILAAKAAPPEPEDGDELIVTIGEPEEDEEEKRVAAAPEWVRDLRKEHRETKRKLKQLEEENARLKTPATSKAPTLPPKPTLAGCDYDEAKFASELTVWYDAKRKVEEATEKEKAEAEEQELAWKKKVDKYNADKAALTIKVKDFPEAEKNLQAALDATQQGIILHGAENPSLLVLALGKNQKKLDELAAIKDHVKFAFTIAKLEAQMKVTPRKPATPPEKVMTSTAPVSGAVDGHLEKLRADAEKTGDYSKVLQYKRERRQQASK